MSLTNPEMIKIYETAVKISNAAKIVYPAADRQESSFFQDREALHLYPTEIFEYGFDTPLQLKTELTKMWKYQHTDYMYQFINICIVAALKNRNRDKSFQDKQEEISSFIYEF